MQNCPKCNHNYSLWDKECPSCGLIFEKYRKNRLASEERRKSEIEGIKRCIVALLMFIFFIPAGIFAHKVVGSDRLALYFVIFYFLCMLIASFSVFFSQCSRCKKFFFGFIILTLYHWSIWANELGNTFQIGNHFFHAYIAE